MLKLNKFLLVLFFLGLGFYALPAGATAASTAADPTAAAVQAESILSATINPPAPTLVGPDGTGILGRPRPIITGLTMSGTAVYIYIDGVYNGKTEILEHESGTASFAYKPFLDLRKGKHEIWAVSKDKLDNKSLVSNTLEFSVEAPFPAPTMMKPVVNNKTDRKKPFIVGLAKNDSRVKVFIDKKLFGEFKVDNHISGTTDFAYLPFVPLAEGRHMAYSVATDPRGKESIWSNIVYFTVKAAEKPVPVIVAAAEGEFTGESGVAEDESGRITGEAPSVDTPKSADAEEIEKLLNQETDKPEKSGAINEKTEKQGRLDLNLIVFTLFLLAVISWIFWVNRELIRERREEAKKDNEDKDKDNNINIDIK